MSPLCLEKTTSPDKAVRASLFNLIAYQPHRYGHYALNEVLENITSKLPCRSICISMDPSARALKIESIIHTLQKDAYPITCEQINIVTAGADLAKVPFALMPHLLPDLPIYLLWGQSPLADQTILPALQKFATRLVFDADEEGGDWHEFSTRMLEHLQKSPLDIMDVNWALIGAWRDAFVRLFYNPQAIEQLSYSQKLSLIYSGAVAKRDATESIYLCCWLAAQLGWTFRSFSEKAEGFFLEYSHARGSVEVVIAPQAQQAGGETALLSVDITTGNQTHYHLKRHLQGSTATVHISRSDSCDLPFTLPLPTLWRNLTYMKELFHYTAGSHYRNMLYQLASLPR